MRPLFPTDIPSTAATLAQMRVEHYAEFSSKKTNVLGGADARQSSRYSTNGDAQVPDNCVYEHSICPISATVPLL
jgi:hypothetical protein